VQYQRVERNTHLGNAELTEMPRAVNTERKDALSWCTQMRIRSRRQPNNKTCPFAGTLSTSIAPLWLLMMSWLIESPRPVPFPSPFVVKRGVNILSISSGFIPWRYRISNRHPWRIFKACRNAQYPPFSMASLAFQKDIYQNLLEKALCWPRQAADQ